MVRKGMVTRQYPLTSQKEKDVVCLGWQRDCRGKKNQINEIIHHNLSKTPSSIIWPKKSRVNATKKSLNVWGTPQALHDSKQKTLQRQFLTYNSNVGIDQKTNEEFYKYQHCNVFSMYCAIHYFCSTIKRLEYLLMNINY